MRMPVLSYLLVAGTVLFGVLVLVGNKLEPKPLPVSQMVGVPAPFKARQKTFNREQAPGMLISKIFDVLSALPPKADIHVESRIHPRQPRYQSFQKPLNRSGASAV